MSEYSVDHSPSQPTDDAATLQARLEALQQRNAELETKASTSHRPLSGLRSAAVVVLVCLGALLTTAAVPTIWVRNLVLNTDRYVETLQPLATNPGVQSAVVKAVEEQFNRHVDVKGLVADALPARLAATIGGPLQAGAS